MMDITEIMTGMSVKEKIALCSGADFWHTKAMPAYGIPALTLSDGPNGLRKQQSASGTDMLGINNSLPATCFPSSCLTACGFDPTVTERVGRAVGEEAASLGVDVVLGPGANIKRNPLCGRNFEYFSEDPYLTGKMASGWIRGCEMTGVGTSLKHFACNNRETSRFHSDSVTDERTLREIYLSGFETAVKEGRPSTVMSAYNKINGVHCSDSRELLTDVLRNDWGFDGTVITDWGGLNDRMEAFRAGCDLSMPGGSDYMEKAALKAIRRGTLDEKDLDACVRRILRQIEKAGRAGPESPDYDGSEHHAVARQIAGECAVLLKNEGNVLPLDDRRRVVLIGDMAANMRYQGSGSSHINPTRLTAPRDAMPDLPWARGCLEDGSTTDELIAGAVAVAKDADVAVVCAGLPDRFESEGFDRDGMKMPDGHLRMIDAVSSVNPRTVVVLFCGAPVECPWIERVGAVLYMGLPGQAGGEAVKDLLYGQVNPSGRLAESWPARYEDCASSDIFAQGKDALYEEGIYVGYRYYDKAGIRPRFPFGFGLSYTAFRYSALTVSDSAASVTVTNTGDRAGAEAVLLWVCPPQDGIHRPVKELKGFCKVFLQPGESRTVLFTLDSRSFAVWQDGWKVPAGRYTVCVGPLDSSVDVTGDTVGIPTWQGNSWYQTCRGKPSQADLENALGHKITATVAQKGSYTADNSVIEMKQTSLIMKIMFRAVESTVAKGFGGKKDYDNPTFRMMMNASAGAPLRCMQISGGIRGGVFFGLLDMANGHFFRGIGKIVGIIT